MKYIYFTFMNGRRITQVIFFSWVLRVSFNVLKVTLYMFCFQKIGVPLIWLSIIFFEFLPCVVLISMIFHVHKHERSARIVSKQLRFNHQVSFKTHHEKSAVIMMSTVIGVFLVCSEMYLRCSFFYTIPHFLVAMHDENYQIPVLVLNSANNPLAYAFFKRDIKREFKRIVSAAFKQSNKVNWSLPLYMRYSAIL